MAYNPLPRTFVQDVVIFTLDYEHNFGRMTLGPGDVLELQLPGWWTAYVVAQHPNIVGDPLAYAKSGICIFPGFSVKAYNDIQGEKPVSVEPVRWVVGETKHSNFAKGSVFTNITVAVRSEIKRLKLCHEVTV